MMVYNREVLRELMLKAFDPSALYNLCRDRLTSIPAIQGHIEKEMRMSSMVTEVVDICEKHLETDTLVTLIEEKNPRMYELYKRKLRPEKIWRDDIPDYLCKLNWNHHVYQFSEKLRQIGNQPASFVIHGKPDCGQDILVRRLIKLAREERSKKRQQEEHYVCLWRRGLTKLNIDTVWSEINKAIPINETLESKPKTRPERVIKKLSKKIETQDVCIVIDGIHLLGKIDTDRFLHEFWHELAFRMEKKLIECNGWLLLLLVDWEGQTVSWDACRDIQDNFDFRYPVRVPETFAITRSELEYWLRNLPLPVTETTLDELLDETQGIPSLIEEWLYDFC